MHDTGALIQAPLDHISEPPHQLRDGIDPAGIRELADSLARLGLLEPIGVSTTDAGATYTVEYGHRRYLAAQLLGWVTIPAVVVPPGLDSTDVALAENLHRVDLTPLEEARACATLRDRGHSVGDVAHIVRKSESWVHQRLALLDYPPDLQEAVHKHGLPLVIAGMLREIEHDAYRAYLTRDALAHGASARTVTSWVQSYNAEKGRIDANTDTVEELARRRADYVILAPCDYCGEKEALERTRTFRLCSTCSDGLEQAKRQPTHASPSP